MKLQWILAVVAVVLGVVGRPALGVKIADVTRIYGQQNNVLSGIGLVYGLKGTGDGGDFLPAMRPLQAMLERYNKQQASLVDLKNAQNVAIVTVTVTLPSNGVRRGDRLDAVIMSMGAASSLRGGRLVMTQMKAGPDGPVFGDAEGAVQIEDAASPLVGVVKGGLLVEEDLEQPVVQVGPAGSRITLVIDDAASSWGLASLIAKQVNDAESPDGAVIATARDPRTVDVMIPEAERQRPDAFIARVQRLPLQVLPPQEARVIVNTKTSTIIVTGDVEISPVVISYKGLTITTVTPKPEPSPRAPQVKQQTAVPVDTTNTGGAKLQDLVAALEQLKVPAEDRINIIKELHKSGKLHAKLIIDGVMP